MNHPVVSLNTRFVPGPDWPWRRELCPYCGEIEWWHESELAGHGKCRADPGPCPICGEYAGDATPAPVRVSDSHIA